MTNQLTAGLAHEMIQDRLDRARDPRLTRVKRRTSRIIR
jgi:hypothetical protein